MPRVFLIVLDGVGAGEMPDAADYGDQGSNTLGNLAFASGGLNLPAMQSLGLGNIIDIKGVGRVEHPMGSWGRMMELSKGKDTITGHWEMMGIVSETAFPTYPNGFPDEIKIGLEGITKRRFIWRGPSSGTEIIKELGGEHMKTGMPIIYTSADSVLQIAAHEDVVKVDELYDICKAARAMLVGPHNICRVIARPFIGPPYQRTYRRKDFAVAPPDKTLIDMLSDKGIDVVSVGKVVDMFSGRGFGDSIKTNGNTDGIAKLNKLIDEFTSGLVFCNLVDFDTLYGHRNDVAGFSAALEEFDRWLGPAIKRLNNEDYLFITADHGLDPTTPSTDHSREYVPILYYNRRLDGMNLGTRRGFWDIGATLAKIFDIEAEFNRGEGFPVNP